jgi:hypothetical protein
MECAHLAFVFLDSYRTAICPTSGTALQVQPQPPPGPAAPALPPGRSEPFGQIPANTRSAVQLQSWCRRQPGPSRKPSFIGPEDATHTRRQHPALAPPCAVSFCGRACRTPYLHWVYRTASPAPRSSRRTAFARRRPALRCLPPPSTAFGTDKRWQCSSRCNAGGLVLGWFPLSRLD